MDVSHRVRSPDRVTLTTRSPGERGGGLAGTGVCRCQGFRGFGFMVLKV